MSDQNINNNQTNTSDNTDDEKNLPDLSHEEFAVRYKEAEHKEQTGDDAIKIVKETK